MCILCVKRTPARQDQLAGDAVQNAEQLLQELRDDLADEKGGRREECVIS